MLVVRPETHLHGSIITDRTLCQELEVAVGIRSRHFPFLSELRSGHKKSIIMTESKHYRLLLMSNHQVPRRCHLKSQRVADEMIGNQVHLRNLTLVRLTWPELCSVSRCHDEDVQSIGNHGGKGHLTMICTLIMFPVLGQGFLQCFLLSHWAKNFLLLSIYAVYHISRLHNNNNLPVVQVELQLMPIL
jgi:hypothetical protein